MMEKILKWFEKINNIPIKFDKEERISNFLVDFAKERNLEVYQDDVLNVKIKKPATKGYENAQIMIIQGHMDMICEKVQGSNHNFDDDPITFIREVDILRANNTTFVADDGITIASNDMEP